MPDPARHISSSFDAAVYSLQKDVLMVSSFTDRIFHTASEALMNRKA
jgi:hypothetical protein